MRSPLFFDCQDGNLHLSARRKLFAVVGSTRRPHLRIGNQSGLPRAEPDKYPERLHPLNGAGENRSGRQLQFLGVIARSEPLWGQGQGNPSLLRVNREDENGYFLIGRGRLFDYALLAAGNFAHVQQPINAREQFDKDAEVSHPNQTAGHHLPFAQLYADSTPGVVFQGFQTQPDLAAFRVHAEHFDCDCFAHAQMIGRPSQPRVANLGDMHQALYAPKVDKRTEIGQRGDCPRQDCPWKQLLPRLFCGALSLLFEESATGKNDIPLAVLRDVKLKRLVEKFLRGIRPVEAHLREWTKGPHPGDRHFVAPFGLPRDRAFHRQGVLHGEG